MTNNQIAQLALVLSDLSDVGHINSCMSFINLSGQTYVNVIMGDNVFTVRGQKVSVFNPPKELTIDDFLRVLIKMVEHKEVAHG